MSPPQVSGSWPEVLAIALGVLVAVSLAAVLAAYTLRRRRRSSAQHNASPAAADPEKSAAPSKPSARPPPLAPPSALRAFVLRVRQPSTHDYRRMPHSPGDLTASLDSVHIPQQQHRPPPPPRPGLPRAATMRELPVPPVVEGVRESEDGVGAAGDSHGAEITFRHSMFSGTSGSRLAHERRARESVIGERDPLEREAEVQAQAALDGFCPERLRPASHFTLNGVKTYELAAC